MFLITQASKSRRWAHGGCVSSRSASCKYLTAVDTSSKPSELTAYLAHFCASVIAVSAGLKPGAGVYAAVENGGQIFPQSMMDLVACTRSIVRQCTQTTHPQQGQVSAAAAWVGSATVPDEWAVTVLRVEDNRHL